MANESQITQVEKISSETQLLDRTLNSKCHNNNEAKNKDGQKNKRKESPKKKNKGSRKRKYSSSSDESDSDSDEDSSSEDSDIDSGSSSESLRKKYPRMCIPHQGSQPSLQRKRINGHLANS